MLALWRNQTSRGWIYQVVALGMVVAVVWLLANTTLDNMQARGIKSGFDFLNEPAGFDISESVLPFDSSHSFKDAFWAGLANTLKVAVLGIMFATIWGTLLGIARFSTNVLVRGFSRVYLEVIRNVPLLLQLLMWYVLLVQGLPDVSEQSGAASVLLSKAGVTIPMLRFEDGVRWDMPVMGRFGITGGYTITTEFLALLLGLTLYTASYISEIVRSGLASVSKGQFEAAQALGLNRWQIIQRVQLPQALQVIIPPLTNQYLNLTKNSSLAVVVGYPDLVSIADTTINNNGRAIECIAIVMAVYLSVSLGTSLLMNLYNRRVAIKER